MSESNFEQFFVKLQIIFAVITGSTTILGASGYIILHAHLSRYTDIPVVDIPIIYYWIAGFSLAINTATIILSLWIGIKLALVPSWLNDEIKPNERSSAWVKSLITVLWIIAGVSYVIGIGYMIFNYRDPLYLAALIFVPFILLAALFTFAINLNDGRSNWERFTQYFQYPHLVFKHFYRSFIATIGLFLYLAFYTFLISLLYGSSTYALLPVNVGGGNPSTVSFVFSTSERLDQSLLTPSTNFQSEIICVLMPLDDSYLIYDPASQLTLLIPNENIVTVVDSNIDIDCSPIETRTVQTSNPALITTPTSTP